MYSKKYYINYQKQLGGTNYIDNLLPILFKNPDKPGFWEDGGLEVNSKVLEPRSKLYKILKYTSYYYQKYYLDKKNKYAKFNTLEPHIDFGKSDITHIMYGLNFIRIDKKYLDVKGKKIILYLPDPNNLFDSKKNSYLTIINRTDKSFEDRYYDDILDNIYRLLIKGLLNI